jgi:phosphopantothenoylcysteine decarboxylase/phosphopantothenate--cysteine ligase
MSGLLENKKIVVGVAGGIAAFKAVELVRLLVREEASVYVAMSANAKEFITPLTFETLSGQPVYHEVFGANASASMEHIRAAEGADLLVVAPATAGMIGKMANGLADDALSNLFIAFRGPVLLAPAMNDGMYSNPAVQDNIARLKSRGIEFIDPEHGELACGTVGQGRLAEPWRIQERIESLLSSKQDLAGLKFLVTAGPTREPLDPVRYLSNPSSGKMGYAIAAQAASRGAQVTLISGPTHLEHPSGVRVFPCVQADEMLTLVLEHVPDCDVLVMTAAVGDFAPERVQKEKIKKNGEQPLQLKLIQTPDILKEAGKLKTHQVFVGFAAESENVVESAREKLKKKNLDWIVSNDISAPGIGFQSDSNQVTILDKAGHVTSFPLLSKKEIANILLDKVRPPVL